MRKRRARPRGFNRFPSIVYNLVKNEKAEVFKAKDENIGRQRIPLTDTPGGGERLKFPTIEENRDRGRQNAGHDDINYVFRKIEMMKDFTNEAPLKSVKSFLEINLKSHGPNPPFLSFHGVKNLLGKDHVIKAFPTQNQSCLQRRDEVMHVRPNSIDNNFLDDLIDSGAQTYGSKMTQCFRTLPLWNEHHQSLIKVIGDAFRVKSSLNFLNNRLSQDRP